jgi:ABC-type transport system substrate-binding protein
VLTLNSGIRFQDGKPLDAASLIACLQYQLAQNSSATAALPGARLTATGPDQVTLTTKAPVPNMPYILGDENFFIIYDQAAYLKAKGSPAKLIAAKIYTGPYVVTDVSDEIMHEVRNPIYWDGTPKLSEVTVKFITDAQSRILAVEHGEADLALYPPTTAAKTLTGRTDAAKAEQLLTSDGWVSSSPGGVRHKDGKALAFTIDTYAEQPDTATLAVAMQAELSAVGFDVSISQVPDIDAAQKNPAGRTSALEGDGTTSFAGDPITPLQEYWAGNGPENTTGVNNPALNKLISQLAVTVSASGRDALLKQTQQVIGDNAYTIFVGQRLPAVIAGPAWRNYPVPAANLWVNATTAPSN